jgi:hypothetical protein
MPKVEIDYTNTIFYKIYCKNSSITDVYIGHTTNFIQRKHAHKQSCLNNKSPCHTYKLYKVIRDHGGWDNWNMEIIAFHACEDHYSARKQEQYYFEEYKATLNSIEPLPKPKIIIKYDKKEKINRFCETCNISFFTEKQQDDHNKTKKHINRSKILTNTNTMTNEYLAKNRQKFKCDKCDYICSKQSDYTKHLMTRKHGILTNTNEKSPKFAKTRQHSPKFAKTRQHSPTLAKAYMCSCGKSYKHSSSLCGHKKKCNYIEEIKNEVIEVEPEVIELGNAEVIIGSEEETNDPSYKEMFMEMMKKNTELVTLVKEQQKQIGDIIPKIGNNNTTNNTNTNNNNFNLQVFLNETCKDAMNIKDFIESLRVQCSEMKEIQNIGFIELASKVLLKELSEMDVSKRPIHCSDLKRETLYIKDNNVWEKESESKPTMLTMMKQMQKVSYTTLDIWISKHPGCQRYDHPQHNLFMNTWGDICILDECKDVKKISKRIAKEVLIDKTK